MKWSDALVLLKLLKTLFFFNERKNSMWITYLLQYIGHSATLRVEGYFGRLKKQFIKFKRPAKSEKLMVLKTTNGS